jgi:serine/threonine protein kinase
MTFDEAVTLIDRATSLGDLGGSYRTWAKLVHPDTAPPNRGADANRAFAKLSTLTETIVGDIADISGHGDGKVLKMPRRPGDNDLMAAEAWALRTLWTEGEAKHRAYAPKLIESFTHEDANRVRRTANVLERLDGFVPIADIGRRIDPRDAAWMWRRLLVALGWAHRAGVVHGAVLPSHILIHPERHGVVLIDWCYAVAPGQRIPALVSKYRDLYAPEVTAREGASAATDIFMATQSMIRLIDRPPAALRRFADGCCLARPRMRPDDAWRLLAEFDELLEDLYGPRTFREFRI